MVECAYFRIKLNTGSWPGVGQKDQTAGAQGVSRAHRRCWNSVCSLLGLCTVRGDPATWWAGALLLRAAQGGQISMGWAGKAGVAQFELGAGIWSLCQIQRSVFRMGCTHPELRGRSAELYALDPLLSGNRLGSESVSFSV